MDAVILSFEHGLQKPDAEIFQLAWISSTCGLLGQSWLETAMHDGAAAVLGISTIIIPARHSYGPRNFEPLLRLLND